MSDTKRAYERVKDRVAQKVREAEDRARQSKRKRTRATLYVWRLLVHVVRQWRRDRCPQHAAGLSYQILLSLVPALAVAFAIFRATGAMEAESSFVKFLSSELLPLSREEISTQLLSWTDRINIETMGIVGLVATMLIAFVLFNSLERTINTIWRVEKRRSLPRRLLAFLLSFTVGPLLAGLSMYYAARFGLTMGWTGALLSPVMTFAGLFLANLYLPAVAVRARPAAVGAAVNTIAVELAKFAFGLYVARFAMDRYAGIYGTVAIVPLLLIWVYWSWLVFLMGVELTHIVQNFGLLESRDQRTLRSAIFELEGAGFDARGGLALLRLVALSEDGLEDYELGQHFDVGDDAIRRLCHRLRDRGLLRRSADGKRWLLAKAAEDITLLAVLEAFREGEALLLPVAQAGAADPLLDELYQTTSERAAALRLSQLFIQDKS